MALPPPPRIRLLEERIARLRASGTDARAEPGLAKELGPPVDSALLAEVEAASGCALPDGYRDFMLAHDGGAGPYWGILSLSESLASFGGDLSSLGRDFPLTSDVDFGELCGKPERWSDHVARLASDPAYVAAYEKLRAQYEGFDALPGRLPICEYGCGDYFFVVVRGPRRGSVWVDSVDSATGVYCLEVDILEFYERWLARLSEPARGEERATYKYLSLGRNPRYRRA